jgi:hypothetical protein
MATYLNRTPSSASNRKTWTFSTWIKRGIIGTGGILTAGGSGQDQTNITFSSSGGNDRVDWQIYSQSSGSTVGRLTTTQQFRDPSAWYHLVCRYDSTQGTAGDRMRMYLNGSEITAFSTDTNPSQNFDAQINNNVVHDIGRTSYNNSNFFSGYLAQTILADGQSYAPTVFGSTNANGIWVPNTSPSVTYGTNGFKLDFAGTGTAADASGFGADSSGNGNHFTSGGLGTNPSTSDTCQNNFCTLNPLQQTTSVTLSNGNLVATNTANDQGAAGTMSFSAGKWYWEVKLNNLVEVGVNLDSDILQLSNDATVGSNDSNLKQTALVTNSAGGSNDFRFNGSTETVNSTACSDGDILMVAVDADNTKIYYGKNGTWMNSGNPAGGSGELKNFSSGYTAGNFITPTFQNGIGTTASCQFNFGNPPFTISSGNADANGYGNFEYAVPSGYYALCTKNLAAYGG